MVLSVLVLAAFSQLTFAQELPGSNKKAPQPVAEQRQGQQAAVHPPSVGPAPIQASRGGGEILPDAGNPVSRAWCYNGAGPFQLNRQSLTSTALTPIGAAVTFGFPGAAAWVTTTNQMYVVDQAAPFALYRVDTLTGVRTFIANCTGVPQANLTGMTFDPSSNTMYGVSTTLAVSQIFTINITTGVCTPIGSPSAVAPGVIQLNAAPGGSLFSTDIVTDNLYKWNKTTGVPTLVGSLGFDINFGQDGHFDFSDGQYLVTCFNNSAFQAQLRIIDTLTGLSTLEGTYGGQIETFAIYTPPQPPCTGTPNPGNTLANTATACPAVPVVLTLQNYTPGSQITYQWQKATAGVGGPYSNVAGTSASYSFLQTVAGWYRCIVTCVATGNSGTSTPVFVGQNPFYNCYCNSVAGSNADEDIFNVTFGTINQTSNCATVAPGPGSINRRYSNYRNVGPPPVANGQQVIGNNLPISVQVGTCGGNFGSAVGVWIDINQNGAFEHPAERVFLSNTVTGPHIASGLANIPLTALTGITGMRVINVETTNPAGITPCGAYTWGETEDYLIDLIPCVPILGVTGPTSVTAECSGIVAITPNTGLATLPQFRWEARANAAAPWNIINNGDLGGTVTGATSGSLVLINVPNTLNGYQFRAIVTNPCSGPEVSPITTLTVVPLVARVTPTSATICRGSIQQLSLLSPQAVFCSGTVNQNVPDNNATGVTNVIPVSGIPASATITEIRVTYNMTHTWVGDMVINLRAPNGQTINLIGLLDGGTGSNGTANFVNTTVSSDDTRPAMSGAPAPRTGIFRADKFNTVGVGPNSLPTTTTSWAPLLPAATINGNWTLGMCDLGPADLGVLQNWCITISYGAPVTGIWTQNPAAPNTMFTDPACTVAYTGTPISTIYVNPVVNTSYTVIASTAAPACTSAPVTIPVNVTQPIGTYTVAHPTNKSVCVGGTTTFTVGFNPPGAPVPPAPGPFAYQWQESKDNGLNWSNLSNGGVYSGVTTSTLTLTGVTRSAPDDMNNYRYRCVVSTLPCAGSFTSNTATLTVFALPTVSISASDLALTPGQQSTLTGTSSPAPLAATSWSWTLNGSAVPVSALNAAVNTASIKADIDKLGNYRATVTDVNGCTNSSNTLLIEAEVADRLWIYPNPNNGVFQVRLYHPGVYTERRRLQIFNQLGQEILSRDLTLTNTTPHYLRMDVDLSLQPSGVYVVKVIEMYTGKAASGFVVKQ